MKLVGIIKYKDAKYARSDMDFFTTLGRELSALEDNSLISKEYKSSTVWQDTVRVTAFFDLQAVRRMKQELATLHNKPGPGLSDGLVWEMDPHFSKAKMTFVVSTDSGVDFQNGIGSARLEGTNIVLE